MTAVNEIRELRQRLTTRQTVLIVEDQTSDLEMLLTLLNEFSELNVFVAGTGQQAIDLIAGQKMDKIFLDLRLNSAPDGLDVLRMIPDKSGVVVVTGLPPDAPDIITALAIGAAKFITKPVTREDLAKVF